MYGDASAALDDGRLLSDDMQRAMLRDLEKNTFGLGLEIVPLTSRLVPGKRGNATGFDCVIGFVPDTHRRFVILTNHDERLVYDLVKQLLPPTG